MSARLTALRPSLPALAPGLLAVGLMLLWAIHNGGYDAEAWSLGALLLLAALAAVLLRRGILHGEVARSLWVAIGAFTLYVAWSYLSILWAQSPGDALLGSDRALLYLIAFSLMAVLPWTTETAIVAVVTLVIGIAAIAFVLLYRLATSDHVTALVIDGRLAAPTGYFNATAALFTLGAFAAIVLGSRRELPVLVRGLLGAGACAGLQLAVVVQSRGWLFTLAVIALIAVAVAADRLRVAGAAILPAAGALIPLRRLLHVYGSAPGSGLDHAAHRAGQAALMACGAVFVLGTILAWVQRLRSRAPISERARRAVGALILVAAIGAAGTGAVVATHGHPGRFLSRQWRGLRHPVLHYSAGSHFTDIGSGRYDFWRVSLKAFLAHPVGGLGQDNFADYYVSQRHTSEEPSWTHSLEMRVLAHTGIVGALLFGIFLIAAAAAAISARRRAEDPLARAAIGAAIIPFAVWLSHGSADWFWEIPALTVPALGLLAMAGRLRAVPRERRARRLGDGRLLRITIAVAGSVALVTAATALGSSYLAARKLSFANDLRRRDPVAALAAVADAARLDPLSAAPGRLGGMIALSDGRLITAEHWFKQATVREPAGWLGWLGDGLAASALGDAERAHRDFAVAATINSQQPAIKQALARVYTSRPLAPAAAIRLLVLVH